MAEIGRLERIPLREVWKHEAHDFSVWLQQNVDVLNDALGITLLNVEREQSAGDFFIDMIAEDEAGRKVIIENQLERSNHDHLGKVLTYVAAMNAQVAIWIVREARPEHVAAFSWLNESSSAEFHLLVVEAVKIGNSLPAPILTRIVGPSAETEAVATSNRRYAERHELCRKWWTALQSRPGSESHRVLAPAPSQYLRLQIGSGFRFVYLVWENECGIELYIDGDAKGVTVPRLEALAKRQVEVERQFGEALTWENISGARGCRVKFKMPGGYRSDDEDWEAIQTAQVSAMNRLMAALRPGLAELGVNY